MRRGDSSMPSTVMSSKRVSPDKARVSPWRVAPTVAGRVESLRGRMGESARQVEGLFESLLAESFMVELLP
jgi:hypothetical protein